VTAAPGIGGRPTPPAQFAQNGPWSTAAQAVVLCALLTVGATALSRDDNDAMAARGRATLRAMDCARCHGRDYDGWSAPSLLAALRDGSRERFDRIVLDGDIVRGMPGYRSQPRVVADLDAIYVYLQTRQQEKLGQSDPGPDHQAESDNHPHP
jgi:mono/diheme cytochrome c family protein